jgi:hypothetical protein
VLGLAALTAAALALSGGTRTDPPLPSGFPGVKPSFLLGGAVETGEAAARRERRWLSGARPLGAGAPAWAERMYERSLLVLRALTDPRSGASVAGAREGWAYVWPRDAGTAAIAFAAAGYRPEARRVTRFLLGLDLGAAARFRGTGEPVPGRDAQGDAVGWVAAAVRAAGLAPGPPTRGAADGSPGAQFEGLEERGESWRDRADYQEKDGGDYLGNALATQGPAVPFPPYGGERNSGSGLGGFVSGRGLTRVEGDPDSGWDSAAAWGVRPFAQPQIVPAIRRTLHRIAADSGRFGVLPSENWDGGVDPWTAPTAWTAWALAALARRDRQAADRLLARGGDSATLRRLANASRDRGAALHLMTALRRAATPAGLLPERVDAHTGLPTSTTPLGWSHAFAILALRELWPQRIRH